VIQKLPKVTEPSLEMIWTWSVIWLLSETVVGPIGQAQSNQNNCNMHYDHKQFQIRGQGHQKPSTTFLTTHTEIWSLQKPPRTFAEHNHSPDVIIFTLNG